MAPRFCVSALFLVLVCPAVRALPNETAPAPRKVKLGAILALTGTIANSGAACRNGIEMALQELPAERRNNIEVLIEDDENLPRKTLSAFAKLVDEDRVDAVITYFSGTSKSVAPLADKKGVAMIAIASDPEVVAGRSHVFNLWVSPEAEVGAMLKEIQCRGYRNVAVAVATQQGALAFKKIFDEKRSGLVAVALEEEYLVDARDFRPFLSKVKAAGKLDAMFVEVMFGQAGLFAKQAREMGISLPLFSVEVFEDPAEVAAAAGALTGQWYVQADDPMGEFLKRYQQKYPGQSSYTAANCYDAVNLVAAAVAKGTPVNELHRFLANLKDYAGALGAYSASGDNCFSLPAAVKIVTADGFRKLNDADRKCVGF
jgi:branched-chain amino acid transport system substrate-binding protein